MSTYIEPEFFSSSFHCPNCQVYAAQIWSSLISATYDFSNPRGYPDTDQYQLDKFSTAKCSHCGKISIWYEKAMVFPFSGNIEPANTDLPEDVLADYNEARNIVNFSPKGAAALLRLALQKLIKYLGENSGNLSKDIDSLVNRGLPVQLQQSLHCIRVIGNHAVHPGQIDFNDNREISVTLFHCINIICSYFITNPRKIDSLYNQLPEKDKNNISKRNSV